MRWLFPSLTISPRRSHIVFLALTLIAGAIVITLVSCSSSSPSSPPPTGPEPLYASATGDALRLTMTAANTYYSSTDDIAVVLTLENISSKPIKLHYSSSKHFDLVVLGADESEIYRWSNEHVFQEAIEIKSLAPNEKFAETLIWPGDKEVKIPLRLPGSHELVGSSAAKEAKGIEVKGDISIK